jgi:uncharacterized damage-inducible protein DinB
MEQTTSAGSASPAPRPSDTTAKTAGAASPKQQFLDVFKRESATTRRVLHAMAEEHSEFRPHPRSQCAREIASIFSFGQGGIAAALTNNWQWPPQFPPVPATYAEVLANFEATNQAVLQALENAPESRLYETVPFITGPKQFGDVRVIDLLWFMLLDSIHHRGQLSIYVRMTEGKVPSIYGPSADEPWM